MARGLFRHPPQPQQPRPKQIVSGAAGPVDQQLTATLSFVGSIKRADFHVLTATLSFVGALAKQTRRGVAGTLSFVGALAGVHLVVKLLTATLSFVGSLGRQTGKSLAGTLAFVGDLRRAIAHVLTATLSFLGSLVKRTSRAFSGTLSFAGSLGTIKAFTKALTGTLSFAGAVARQTGKSLAGTLSFIGTVVRAIGHNLSGTLSFAGSLIKRTARALAGTLNFSGLLNAVKTGGPIVYQQAVAGTLAFVGTLNRRTSHVLTATLTFVGTTSKNVRRALSGTLSFVGSLATARLYSRALTATLSFSGSLVRGTGKALTGTLSLSGTVTRRIARGFAGALSFVGNLVASGGALTVVGGIPPRISAAVASAVSAIGSRLNPSGSSTAAVPSGTASGQSPLVPPPMAAFVQSASGTHSGAPEQVTVTLGAPPTAGNLLVVRLGVRGTGGTLAPSLAGWTFLGSQTNPPATDGLAIGYRIAQAGDPAAMTFAMGAGCSGQNRGTVVEYTGLGALAFLDSSTVATGNSTAPSMTVDPTHGSGALLIAGVIQTNAAGNDYTGQNGETERDDGLCEGFAPGCWFADRIIGVSSGPYTLGAITAGSGGWAIRIAAFRSGSPDIMGGAGLSGTAFGPTPKR